MTQVVAATPLDAMRTWLFVPGDRPERFAKAKGSGADAVIIDLEDAVAADSKERARRAMSAAIAADPSFVVRISACASEDGQRDLEALAAVTSPPQAVVVAKAEDVSEIQEIGRIAKAPVIALIESARGLEAARALAASPAVVRLAFGAVDLTLDLDAEPADDVLAPVRSHLVVASRSAGISAPLDSPSLEIRDLEGVKAAARTARRFGMGGKLCIHPAQVAEVAAAFAPTAAEVAHARAILAAAENDGAAQVGGQMIDLPVLVRARRVIEASTRTVDPRPRRTSAVLG